MKRQTKVTILVLLFVPGALMMAVGAFLAYRGRAAIDDAVVAAATVARVFEKTERDLNGKVSRDWVSVQFQAGEGAETTFESEVFTNAFLSVGDEVEVLYSAREPSRARLSAGFFAEPYAVVFLVLFGLFWLLLPGAIVAFVYPRS